MQQNDENKRVVNIGMLGHGFMGKVHSHAYSVIEHIFETLSVKTVLKGVAGTDEKTLSTFKSRFGYQYYATDWKAVIEDQEIDIVNICLPEHLHADACLHALQYSKHILCEKPLSLTTASCRKIVEAASKTQTTVMCGFNYRFLPAVALARNIITKNLLGKIYYITANYCQESGHNPDRPAEQVRYAYGPAQLGTIRGLGSHLIDTTRYLLGDISSVNALLRTFTKNRRTSSGKDHTVKADELATMIVEFSSGAVGSLTTSAVSTGRKNQLEFEINGEKGSLVFNLENPNYLSVYLDDSVHEELRGFSMINVTEKTHPLMADWWPPAHNLGWEHGHINQIKHFLECVSQNKDVAPIGATFEDGLKACEIAEEAYHSSLEGQKKKLINSSF